VTQSGMAAASEEAVPLRQGDQVEYIHRSGELQTAEILTVHHEMQPPYYTILLDGAVRETERDRLLLSRGSDITILSSDADDSNYAYQSEEDDAKYGYDDDLHGGANSDDVWHGAGYGSWRERCMDCLLEPREKFIEKQLEDCCPGMWYQDELGSTCENPMCCHSSCYCRVVTVENVNGMADEGWDQRSERQKDAAFRHMVLTHASFTPHKCNCANVAGCRNIEMDFKYLAHNVGNIWDSAQRENPQEPEVEISDLTKKGVFEGLEFRGGRKEVQFLPR
jgi:hypothetical protein